MHQKFIDEGEVKRSSFLMEVYFFLGKSCELWLILQQLSFKMEAYNWLIILCKKSIDWSRTKCTSAIIFKLQLLSDGHSLMKS